MPKLREYPMEFVNPNNDEMRGIFKLLSCNESVVDKWQPNQEFRAKLVARGSLFTMVRPQHSTRSYAHNYLHPGYTEAAFQDAPDLQSLSPKKRLPALISHLKDFGAEPSARDIVHKAIVQHFNRIADVSVCLPDLSGPWIPGYATEGDPDPLGRMGIAAKYVAAEQDERYVDKSSRKTYFAIEKVAEHIGWTIPSIESEDTQRAILEGFEATQNDKRAVNPGDLFLAGKVLLNGAGYTPLHNLFQPGLSS